LEEERKLRTGRSIGISRDYCRVLGLRSISNRSGKEGRGERSLEGKRDTQGCSNLPWGWLMHKRVYRILGPREGGGRNERKGQE